MLGRCPEIGNERDGEIHTERGARRWGHLSSNTRHSPCWSFQTTNSRPRSWKGVGTLGSKSSIKDTGYQFSLHTKAASSSLVSGLSCMFSSSTTSRVPTLSPSSFSSSAPFSGFNDGLGGAIVAETGPICFPSPWAFANRLLLSLGDLLELNFVRPNPRTNEADCSMLKTSVLLHPRVPNRLKETNARTVARGRWTSPRLSPVAADVKGLRNTDPATTAICVPTSSSSSSSSLLRSTPYNWSGNKKTKGVTKKKKQTDNQNTRSSNSLSQEKKRKKNCLSTNRKFQFFSQQKLVNTFS